MDHDTGATMARQLQRNIAVKDCASSEEDEEPEEERPFGVDRLRTLGPMEQEDLSRQVRKDLKNGGNLKPLGPLEVSSICLNVFRFEFSWTQA